MPKLRRTPWRTNQAAVGSIAIANSHASNRIRTTWATLFGSHNVARKPMMMTSVAMISRRNHDCADDSGLVRGFDAGAPHASQPARPSGRDTLTGRATEVHPAGDNAECPFTEMKPSS